MPGCYYWHWGNNHAHCANAVSEYLCYGMFPYISSPM